MKEDRRRRSRGKRERSERNGVQRGRDAVMIVIEGVIREKRLERVGGIAHQHGISDRGEHGGIIELISKGACARQRDALLFTIKTNARALIHTGRIDLNQKG